MACGAGASASGAGGKVNAPLPPNPSIERTSQRPLRALWHAARVERYGSMYLTNVTTDANLGERDRPTSGPAGLPASAYALPVSREMVAQGVMVLDRVGASLDSYKSGGALCRVDEGM